MLRSSRRHVMHMQCKSSKSPPLPICHSAAAVCLKIGRLSSSVLSHPMESCGSHTKQCHFLFTSVGGPSPLRFCCIRTDVHRYCSGKTNKAVAFSNCQDVDVMPERETSDAMPLSKPKLHARLPTYPGRADINTLEYGPIHFTGSFSSLPYETPILTPSTPGATASRRSKQTQWIDLQRLLLLRFPLHG
jgi:hypothetical protein